MTQTAISTALAVRMMAQAGMGENAIIAAFAGLKPLGTFDGAKYWNPTEISRAIKAQAVTQEAGQ